MGAETRILFSLRCCRGGFRPPSSVAGFPARPGRTKRETRLYRGRLWPAPNEGELKLPHKLAAKGAKPVGPSLESSEHLVPAVAGALERSGAEKRKAPGLSGG